MFQLLIGVASVLFFGYAFIIFSTDKKEEVDWRYRLGTLGFVLVGIWMVIDSGLFMELIGSTLIFILVAVIGGILYNNRQKSSTSNTLVSDGEYKESNHSIEQNAKEEESNTRAIKTNNNLELSSDPVISELNENVKVKFPLEQQIYLPEAYIHPITQSELETIKQHSEKEYDRARRTVINNNKKLNKTNVYFKSNIASNKYHEMEFPVIGIKPDLEEFTDQYVWDDEKIYYKGFVRETIPYDMPDYYLSTSSKFGTVRIGNTTKVGGKKNAGWFPVQRGEFYITERQILLFDEGPNRIARFYNALFDSKIYTRNVRKWDLSEINYIEGNIEEGVLLISSGENNYSKLHKMDEQENNLSFTEDELRYIVNLVGSLTRKTIF